MKFFYLMIFDLMESRSAQDYNSECLKVVELVYVHVHVHCMYMCEY